MTLRELQDYVKKVNQERGFDKETIAEKFMLFLEECGEFSKAARKTRAIKTDKNSEIFKLENEVADVLSYLVDICNQFEIDIEKAFREKEEINNKRKWE